MQLIARTAAVAALLLASACSGDPEPIEPGPDPTPSASPSLTPPSLPKEGREYSASGAATYVQYWVDTFNFAAMTGDSSNLKAISQQCSPCLAYARDFENLDQRQLAKVPPWSIEEVTASDEDDPILITAGIDVAGSEGSTRHQLEFALGKGNPFVLHDIKELK